MLKTWQKGAYHYLELKEDIGNFSLFRYNQYGQELEVELETIADNVYRYNDNEEFYNDYFVIKNTSGVYFKYARNDFKKPPPNENEEENNNGNVYDTSYYEIVGLNVEPFTLEEQPFNRQNTTSSNINNRQIVYHNIISWFGYDSGVVTTSSANLHMANYEVISKEDFDNLTPQDIKSGNFIVYKDENDEVFATVGYTNGNTIVYTPAVNLLDVVSTSGRGLGESFRDANYNFAFIVRDAYTQPFYGRFNVIGKEWLSRPYYGQSQDVYRNERYKGQNGTFTISGTSIQVDIKNNNNTYNSLDWETAEFLGTRQGTYTDDFLIKENYSRGLMLPSNPLRTTQGFSWEGTYILGSNELDRSFGIVLS